MNGSSITSAHLRRGLLFLVNIGVPLVVGVWRGEPVAALLGAVVGMLFSFADNDGELLSRLRLLAIDAAVLGAGGLVGWLCRDSAAALWAVFVAITLSVGMAARSGREPLLAGRHGAMAFTVAATIPEFQTYQLWYLLGAFALNAVSRTIDHLLAGPCPMQPAAQLQVPSAQAGWFRFALAFSGAAVVALWIGKTLDPVHTIWVVVTTIVVMQPDARASYRRIIERVLGTFIGVIAASLITMLFHSAIVICIVIILIAPLIPHHLAYRYWLHTALIALMVLLAYDLTVLSVRGMAGVLTERLEDILLGCAIALFGTAAAFPHEAVLGFDQLVGGPPPKE
jgi:hypothetical protein